MLGRQAQLSTSPRYLLLLASCLYTVSGKKVPLYFCMSLREILTDFQNSFTITLGGKFAVK